MEDCFWPLIQHGFKFCDITTCVPCGSDTWTLFLEMSRLMTKPTKWHVRPAKTSLGIRPVWSEPSLSAWRKLGSLATYWAHSEYSDQTGRMPRLIWVFAGRTVILLVLSWGGSNRLMVWTRYKRNYTNLLRQMRISVFELSREIMALFVLRKFILQTRMCRHSVGLDVWFLVGPFVYFQTLYVRTAKALARLRGCSPEPSLVAYAISTIISWAGSFNFVTVIKPQKFGKMWWARLGKRITSPSEHTLTGAICETWQP